MTPFPFATLSETLLSGLSELDGVVIDIREPAAVDPERDAAALAGNGLLLLTPEMETWKTVTMGPNAKAQLNFPLRVTFVTSGNLQFADRTVLAAKHGVREAIRLAMLKVGAIEGVPSVTYEPEPPYDTGALEKLYRVSKQRFTALTVSARASS